jgi:hypothetical protein
MKSPCAALLMFCTLLAAAPATKPADQKPPDPKPSEPFDSITRKDIDAITYEDAAIDNGFVTPLAQDLAHLDGDDDRKNRYEDFVDKLSDWEPGREKALGQRVRNWMAVCTFGDLGRSEFEAEVPYAVFEKIKKDIPRDQLIKALAWVILKPNEGKTITKAPDLGVEDELDEEQVRLRSAIYAKKLLGRLLGKLPPKE